MNTTSTNKEALLILYLADELSAEQRQDVERMLASDPAMRRMLEELGSAQGSIAAALARLDELQPMPQAEVDAISRRTARAMRQWQTRRIALRETAPGAASQPRRGLAGWRGYALAAAVAILSFGLYVFLGQRGVSSTPAVNNPDDSPLVSLDDWRNLESPVDPTNPSDREAAEFAAAFDPRPPQYESMADLEQEMSKLNELAGLGRSDAGAQ